MTHRWGGPTRGFSERDIYTCLWLSYLAFLPASSPVATYDLDSRNTFGFQFIRNDEFNTRGISKPKTNGIVTIQKKKKKKKKKRTDGRLESRKQLEFLDK